MPTQTMTCCSTTEKETEKITSFLKIINEPHRLKILCLLKKEDLCVCDILKLLNAPQNLISHHLNILKKSNLIDSKKDGRKIFYSSNRKEILQHTTKLNTFLISNL